MLNENVVQFAALEVERRTLEAKLDDIKSQIKTLEASILDEFTRTGISSLHIGTNGTKLTVYVHRQLWAKAKDGNQERACLALKSAGMEDFVKESFNSQTLSAYIRELDREGTPIPTALEDAIDVSEVYSVRTRKES